MDLPQKASPASHYEQIVEVKKPISSDEVKQQAFKYMKKLEGWCAENKAAILIDLILKSKPNVVVEIGVFGGKSVIPMACALQANDQGVIYGIDPWSSEASIEGMQDENSKQWWTKLDHEAILRGLVAKIKEFDLKDQIVLIKATSEDAPPIPNIDILHIDGNHSYEASYLDVTKWGPLVKSGGWIILDDMTWFENGIYTQSRSVDWLNQHCIKIAEFKDPDEVWGIWLKP